MAKNGALISTKLREAGDYPAVIGVAAHLARDSASVEFWHVQGELEAGPQEFLYLAEDARAVEDGTRVVLDWPGLPVSLVERQGLASGGRATLPIVKADG